MSNDIVNIPVDTNIDTELCIGCGVCVKVCPHETLSMKDDKAFVSGEFTLGCDHCAAICPVDAIKVGLVDDDALDFATLPNNGHIVAPGEFDTLGLVSLMRSRRSTRNYKDKPVSTDILEDLVKIAITAPSGTNNQLWSFTLLPNQNAVKELGEHVLTFFEKLNKMAVNPFLRFLSKLFMKDALGIYYRGYYETVTERIKEYRETGKDKLFHGATAVIVVSMRPGASCPKEDALLASQNILLAAHSMGLGSCLIGFAVEAFKNEPSIKQKINIPKKETVHAVIALGYPDEKYKKLTGRKTPELRYFKG